MSSHVFIDVDNISELAQFELLGAGVPTNRARDESDMLRLANQAGLSLSSAVSTQKEDPGQRFTIQIGLGMAYIDDISVNNRSNLLSKSIGWT